MNKSIIALFIIPIILISFGCVSSHKNPTKLYQELRQKFNNTEKINIDYNAEIGSGMEYSTNFKMKMKYEKEDVKSKLVASVSFMGETGVTAAYLINNTDISCTESNGELECEVDEYNDMLNMWNAIFYSQIDNQTKISFKGTKEIAGRTCYDFEIENQSVFSPFGEFGATAAPTKERENPPSIIQEVCLDKQTGALLLSDVKQVFKSKITNETQEVELFKINATKVSFDVKDSDFKIPVSFVLKDVSCNTKSITIDIVPFDKMDYLNWSDERGESNGKIDARNLELYKENNITIPTRLDYGSHRIKVCYNNDCSKNYCFIMNPNQQTYPAYPNQNFYNTNVKGSIVEEKEIPKYEPNLIENGDFSNELNGWIKEHGSNTNDIWDLSIINDSNHINVLEFERNNSDGDGGHVYAVQEINKDVSNYKNLTIKLSLKVIYHDLLGGGSWRGSGDFPVHIYIHYLDGNNQTQFWSWGFTTEESEHPNCNIVNYNKWYHFTSENLMNLNPKPVKIVDIKVGGNGWDFKGMVDDVELIAK